MTYEIIYSKIPYIFSYYKSRLCPFINLIFVYKVKYIKSYPVIIKSLRLLQYVRRTSLYKNVVLCVEVKRIITFYVICRFNLFLNWAIFYQVYLHILCNNFYSFEISFCNIMQIQILWLIRNEIVY